ncbi:MAG: hypothetical protein R3F19_07995 [Verrucomicrobiales bacterium]
MNPHTFARTLSLVAALAGAWTTSSQAEDSATGTWIWSAEGFRGRAVEATATLKQDGSNLSGTYDGGFGKDSIKNGKIDGETIAFEVVRQFGDRSFTTAFTGKLAGDAITGKIEMSGFDQPRSADWKAWRAPEIDPSGLWKWSTEGRNGQQRDQWVKLAYVEGKLSGTYRTERGHVAIQDAVLKGKELSFKVERGFGDRVFATTYKGTLADKAITGSITSKRGDEERTSDWNAAPDVAVVDPVGSWSWTTSLGRDGQETTNTITLSKGDGATLGGTVKGGFGESKIIDAKLDGDALTFAVVVETDRGTWNSSYSGKIDEDKLKGKISTHFGERTMTIPFEATRTIVAGNPAGTWTWSNRFGRDGAERVSSLKLKADGTTLTGTLKSGDNETAIKDGKIDGNMISFKVEREFGGNTMTQAYTGQVRGDLIKGGWQTGDASANAWISNWEAKRGE